MVDVKATIYLYELIHPPGISWSVCAYSGEQDGTNKVLLNWFKNAVVKKYRERKAIKL